MVMSDPLMVNVEVGKLSEPISKLIDSVSAAASGYARPHQIRRVAAAEAEALIIQTEAEIKSTELRYRAASRIGYLEIRRQQIIESIISKAKNQLPETVSKRPVDEDWIFQFFEIAKDVSNQDMQELWARILAGEVGEPGSFSPRTLHLVRLLKPDDANLFSKLCDYVSDEYIVLRHRIIDDYFIEHMFPHSDLFHLQSLGLVTADPDILLDLPADIEGYKMSYGSRSVYFEKRTLDQPHSFHAYLLTEMGEELYKLTEPEPDYDYLDLLIKCYHGGFDIKVSHIDNQEENSG